MARQSKKKMQKFLEAQIMRAKKVRANWSDQFRVQTARDYFEGKQNPGRPENEWITINKIYSHMKAILPSLYALDPYFYVSLRRCYQPDPNVIKAYETNASIRQAYLNYLRDEVGLKIKVRLAIQDAHFAYGVLKAEYYADLKDNPLGGSPMLDDGGNMMTGDDEMPILEPLQVPINERYVVSRVHPDDFLWDEDSGPLEENWRWVAECVRMSEAQARKHPIYRQGVLQLKKKGTDSGEGDEEQRDRDKRKKGDMAGGGGTDYWDEYHKKESQTKNLVFWKIYHLQEKQWSVIVENGDAPIIDHEELLPGVESHPYAILRFTLRDDSPYPIPPLSQGLDPQKELNMARSDVLKHRKRFNRKYIVNEPMLTEDTELSRLETGDDGTIIKANSTDAIKPIQDAQMDPMRYQEIAYLNNDLTELLGGATDEARGIATADSATQAGILDKRMEIKEGDALSMVTDMVRDLARKLDQLVQAHITREEAVKIKGPQGEAWATVTPEDYADIAGEYAYEVNVGSTIPRIPQMERSSWMAFLGLLANFPQLLLSKHLLKRMAEMHHIEDEVMLNEISDIGQKMMSGQLPMSGSSGSQPGVGEERPESASGGQAGGVQSLFQGLVGGAT